MCIHTSKRWAEWQTIFTITLLFTNSDSAVGCTNSIKHKQILICCLLPYRVMSYSMEIFCGLTNLAYRLPSVSNCIIETVHVTGGQHAAQMLVRPCLGPRTVSLHMHIVPAHSSRCDVTRCFFAGYLISCVSTSMSMALSIGPPLIIPFLLFGGFFLNNR